MDSTTAADKSALIALILERYHEPHRADLERLQEIALELAEEVLAGEVAALRELLELHMFKEEMRAFPMIEQGGSGLLGHLAADMMEEHERIERQAGQLERRIAALAPADRGNGIAELHGVASRFFSDLAAHARLEDEQLFRPLLARRTRAPVM